MVHINKQLVAQIFERHIDSKVGDQIANLIVSNSSSDLLNVMLSMLLSEKRIHSFEPGDYFKVKAVNSHRDKAFSEDTLIDLGLYVDGYVFGQVIKSNDWHNEHDPYYLSIKCNLFYGEELPYESVFSIFELQKIEKSEIPHFNGTYIPRIVELSSEGVLDTKTDSSS